MAPAGGVQKLPYDLPQRKKSVLPIVVLQPNRDKPRDVPAPKKKIPSLTPPPPPPPAISKGIMVPISVDDDNVYNGDKKDKEKDEGLYEML